MAWKGGVRPDEGLMMMQEFDDQLKEQKDKLEHVRLSAVELKENLYCIELCNSDLTESIADHLERLNHLSERVETLHLHTTVFIQMNTKPRLWAGKQAAHRQSYRLGRLHKAEDVQSEFGWSPIRTRRNSNAASEMSCNW
ncbi:hypothetical protein CesoFtcFv8_024237 [Champsocephalus esox]|uniref:Uncharacterized protein n=1 Tax=Champsocephalus esox TaxID=159716 RepID=A0AAN8B5W0_9TELE|nr:hypothetical protein CesoFtcFv8_024237 [Champsocephalus esox]